MSTLQRTKQKKARWVDPSHNKRQYCEICNVWMDRMGIRNHEQGKKHLAKKADHELSVRKARVQQMQQAKAVQSALSQMERGATGSALQDFGLFAGNSAASVLHPNGTVASAASPPVVPSNCTLTTTNSNAGGAKTALSKEKEHRGWNAKKRQRQKSNPANTGAEGATKQKKRIKPEDGHYTIEEETWLEGQVFGEMLEEDMPVQVWLGSSQATTAELRLVSNTPHWQDAIVVAVRSSVSNDKLVDLSYLKEGDEEETMLKGVSPQRIRLLLGHSGDDRIPDTLKEARILAVGGQEQIIFDQPESSAIDESTGLTVWSTVSIQRTTVRSEARQARDKACNERRKAALEAEKLEKEAQARRMEEQKVANADDSALGAYDVWKTGDYKGVALHKKDQDVVTVADLAKKLAKDGQPVAFKKKIRKKGNRRKTFADDD